jgi:surface carbohydrate biosynthesis protein
VTVLNDVLLPIETANRELEGKLLLAMFAAERGFRCHIGVMSQIQAPGFEPAFYISKSVRFAKQVKLMSDLGHVVVAWDEEGLARFNDQAHSSRIEPEALQIPSLLLAWGEDNANLWRRHPFYTGTRIVETGNPRIDLLRPELQVLHRAKAGEYRSKYGQFALLSSNFGIVNHFKASGRKPKISAKSHDPAAFVAFRAGVERHKRRLFEAFLAAIPELAARLSPFNLVIRPHPSEDHAAWRNAAAGLPNVFVVYEGSVVPWQLAASCLIHNGCTSAVEASVLQLPALSYRPFKDPEFDIALPNLLSEEFEDLPGLARRARQLAGAPKVATTRWRYSNLLKKNIASLEGPLACERIVQELIALRDAAPPPRAGLLEGVSARGRHMVRGLTKRFSLQSRLYETHKSDASLFTGKLLQERSRPISDALGRFEKLRFETRRPGVVTISSN